MPKFKKNTNNAMGKSPFSLKSGNSPLYAQLGEYRTVGSPIHEGKQYRASSPLHQEKKKTSTKEKKKDDEKKKKSENWPPKKTFTNVKEEETLVGAIKKLFKKKKSKPKGGPTRPGTPKTKKTKTD
tara:strand:+ start:103 stop:480 length:378 start_codon:yes stop_codon:yes gene_type:complete